MRVADHRFGAEKMRDEYEFGRGVHGKYAKRFAKKSNVIVLAPDVAAQFTTQKAVNDALRSRLDTKRARRTGRRVARRRG